MQRDELSLERCELGEVLEASKDYVVHAEICHTKAEVAQASGSAKPTHGSQLLRRAVIDIIMGLDICPQGGQL